MSTAANKQLIRRYQEAYNRNDLDALDAIVAADIVSPAALPGLPPGLAGAKAVHRILMQAFPDQHVEIDDLIAEGDTVAGRLTVSGTHRGEFMGIPPTNKPFTILGFFFARIADGKIVERWSVADALGAMQQIGALPGPG
jgi:steroid delta-isomerase-like uncharacterized protein